MRQFVIVCGLLVILPVAMFAQGVNEGTMLGGYTSVREAVDVSNQYFVVFKSAPGQAERAMVAGTGATIRYSYSIIPALAVRVSNQSMLDAIKADARVSYTEQVQTYYALGTESDPEMSDVAGDQTPGDATQDILKAWIEQVDNTHLRFSIKVSDLSAVNPSTGDGLPLNGAWKIAFKLQNGGRAVSDEYFVQMRKPETGPPSFSWGFIDATGINSEQGAVDQGTISPATGIISFVISNSTFSGAPNLNGAMQSGDVLSGPYANATQLVGAQGTGFLLTLDSAPDNEIGRNFTLQNIAEPLTISPGNLNFGELSSGQSKSDSLVATNSTAAAITISASSNNADFSISPASASVPASSTLKFYVTFTPSGAGPESGTLTFSYNASGSPTTVTANGSTPAPAQAETHPWGIDAVRAPQSWNRTMGKPIKVAILDTGIDSLHYELDARYKGGYNFVAQNDHPWDGHGHGTHVAGTIAAELNGVGVVGVAPEAELYSLKVLSDAGTGTSADILAAVDWCVQHHMNIASMSLGGGVQLVAPNGQAVRVPVYSPTEELAYKNAYDAGVLIIVASGNDGEPVVMYPAAYQSNMAVGAVDRNLALASFSNYGADLEIVAPGVDVKSTVPRGTGRNAAVNMGSTHYEANEIELSPFTSFSGTTRTAIYCQKGLAPGDFPAAVSGNIALIQRGDSSFASKVSKAQDAGAVAVIIFNNVSGNFNGTLGTARDDSKSRSWVPAVSLSMEDGQTLVGLGTPTLTVINTVDDFNKFSGTSMATPHVSGVAALTWAANPGLKNSQVRDILKQTATDLGTPGTDPQFGAGLVNAEAAVAAAIAVPTQAKSGSVNSVGQSIVWTDTITAAAAQGCTYDPPANSCDRFILTVDPPLSGSNALITVRLDNFAPFDLDLKVTNSQGVEVASSGNYPGNPEVAAFAAIPGTYEVVAVGFVAVAAQYTGTIGVVAAPPTRQGTYAAGDMSFSAGQRLLGSNGGTMGQNVEPSIAIDFAGNIYASAQQGVPGGVDLWRSTDRGQTFQFMGQPDGTQNPTGSAGVGIGGGDNDLVVSTGGYVYLSSLWLGSATISSSFDRGVDWRVSQTPTPAIDREWNAAFGAKTLYMTANQTASQDGLAHLVLVRSDDAGLTFGPEKIVPTPGEPGRQGNLAINKITGSLHNAFTLASALYYWTSSDGGNTFTVAKVVEGANAGNAFPITAVDNAGNVHIVWSNKKDIYMTSLPAGKDPTVASNWLPPVQVNSGPETATSLFPWIIAGDDGSIAVTWYGTNVSGDPDFGTDFASAQWKVYFTQCLNAMSATPLFKQVAASGTAHVGTICLRGLDCDLNGGNRNLAEYYSMAVDNDGMANIVYSGDVGTPGGSGFTFYAKQQNGTSLFHARPAPAPLSFAPAQLVDAARQGAEPSLDVDSKGNTFIAAITSGANLWKLPSGSASWRFIKSFDTDQTSSGGDIDVTVDKNDKVYFTDLTLPRASVSKSTDGGETFPQRAFTGELDDRPWLATYGDNTVYLGYHDLTNLGIIVERSTDGGVTWTKNPLGITDPKLATETISNSIDGQIAVDKNDGTVYVLFSTSDNLAVVRGAPAGIMSNIYVGVSRDGGQTFTDYPVFRGWVETVDPGSATTKGIAPQKGTSTASLFARVAVDEAGNAYAVWASNNTHNEAQNFDEFSVWLSHSTDKGQTWSAPARVNSDHGTHMLPALAVGGPGKVAIGWYGTSAVGDPNGFALNDPNVRWDVYVANCENALDARPSFSQVKVNYARSPIHTGSVSTGGISSTTADRVLLDYFSIKYDNSGKLHVVWADNFNSPGTPTTLVAGTTAISTGEVYLVYSKSVANAQPVFSVTPSALAFGNVLTGTSRLDSVTVTNSGTATLAISSVTSGNPQFTVTPSNGSVDPLGSMKFYVTFHPTTAAAAAGNIVFTHNAAGSPSSLAVSGTGVATASPSFAVAPTTIDFGSVALGSTKTGNLTVTNSGSATLTISSANSNNTQFTVTPSSASVAASASQAFTVTFVPASVGAASGSIVFTHNATGSPSSVTVSGTGVSASPISFSPSVTGTAPEDPRSGEPSLIIDRDGYVYAGGIRGLTSGGGDLWRWDSKNDPCLRNPVYLGETIQRDGLNGGGLGGGDGALAVSQPNNPTAIPVVTYAGLAVANIPIQISYDRGQTWEVSEVGDLLVGGETADDRQWLTAYGDSTVYLSVRTLASSSQSGLYVLTSIDHGRTWLGKSIVNIAAGTTPGFLEVDERPIGSAPGAGNIYFSNQSTSAMYVSVAEPSPIPGISQTGGPLTFTTYTVDNTIGHRHLFDVIRVGKDGTVYACWSTDFDIYMSYSTNQGRNWSPKVKVNAANFLDANGRTLRTNIMPWLIAGDAGRVGIAWFGSNAANNGDNSGDWAVYYAYTGNALSANPTFAQVQASDGYIHATNVSEAGLGSGNANDRNLLDFFMVDMDPAGAAVITFADDHNDFDAHTYVTRQSSGPGLLASSPNIPPSSCAPVPFDHNPMRRASDPEVTDFRLDAQFGRRVTEPADAPVDIVGIKYIDTLLTSGQRAVGARMYVSLMTNPPPIGFHWFAWFTANAQNNLFDRGQSFYVEASTDPTDSASSLAPRFFYGTSSRQGDGSIGLTRKGTADAGGFDPLTGTVTMYLGLNKINAIATPPIGDGSRLIGLKGLTWFGRFSQTVNAQVTTTTVTGSDVERDYTRGGIPFTLKTNPVFSVSPTSLDFGSILVGSSKKDSLTVSNPGTSTLVISSVTSDNSAFTVTPTSGSVAPSGSQKYYVTFTAASASSQSGNITFAHNANGSPSSVPVTGSGYTITAYDCNDTAITSYGGWHTVSDARATNGYYCRNVGANKSNGAYLSFGFTGFRVDIQLARGPRGGNAQISIDGVVQGKLEFYRPATDPAHPDKSGKTDLTFGLLASYPVTQGSHTLRLDILNDSAGTGNTKRDMDYVDGFVVYGGGTQGTATIRESSTQTNGTAGGGGTNSQSSSPGNAVLMTGVLEVPDGANLDLKLVNPVGLPVAQSTGLNATEVVRYVPTVAGVFNFQVVNATLTPTAYTLYTIKTTPVVALPKTAARVSNEKPNSFSLEQNHPNPFNPSTLIRYQLPVESYVTLRVYNLLGQEVTTLVDEVRDAGYWETTWDASGVGSGIYFYKLIAHQKDGGQDGSFVETKRMMLVK